MFSFSFSLEMVFEGVSAVVENNIILKSEVSQIASMSALQQKIDTKKDPEALIQIQAQVLQGLIDQKAVLEMAKLDSVEVSEKEVNDAMEKQIDNIISQAGSRTLAEEYIGQTIKEFRREFWQEMQERLITDQYQFTLLNKITINRSDVLLFYEEFKDSLGSLPALYKLNHIQLPINPDDKSKKEALEKINSIRNKIIMGESFDSLAVKYSEDFGSSSAGGSLGYVERGSLVKAFEVVAFTQDIDKVSEPVLTEFGYHLIETLDKKGDRAKIRHILVKPIKTNKDETKTIELARSIKDSSIDINSFKLLAKKHSADEKTKKIGGDLGWVDLSVFPIPEFNDVLSSIGSVDSCSDPIKTSYGYHLVWLSDVRPGGSPGLSYHWPEIEAMSLNYKKSLWFQEWLKAAKEDLYIKILN